MPIDGEVVRADSLSGLAGISHGFFTRQGGVSTGLYGALNCGLGSGDEPRLVRENRARVARALAAPRDEVMTLHQVHSATALVVDEPFAPGKLPRADALVTRTPGLVIGALAADCTPVLLAEPRARVVAAAHAGWRGALGGILEAAVEAMIGLGAERSRIHAAIGPCISQHAYEVGPEFESEFLGADPRNAQFFSRDAAPARPRFDLPGYVEHRLSQAGLAVVERRSPCSYGNESLFFSYRRATHRKEPDYGRQISAIVLT
ncbi:MAG: peptidoglycan editing factor PgeF [Hyphomicrobiaceae bacterium]|nr:peptidoglycan editing factor PgeF [Hyphomicrobiaceae bacterium]